MLKQLSFTKRAPDVATPESLKALETNLNIQLPPAFVEFCFRWNGGFASKENMFYPVPPVFKEFYDEYKKSKGVYVDTLFGATEQLPYCGLLKECASLGDFSRLYIPITVDLLGDQAVLRTDSPMGLVYWADHTLWEAPDKPCLIPIADDLESFYNSLTVDPDR